MNDPRVDSIYYSAVIEFGPVRGRRRPPAHGPDLPPDAVALKFVQACRPVNMGAYSNACPQKCCGGVRRRTPPRFVFFYCIPTRSNTRPARRQSEEIKVHSVHAYISFIIRPRRTPPFVVGSLRCRDIGSARIRRNIRLVGEFSGARDGKQNVD